MHYLHFSFLASGDSYMTLAGRFRLGISTVSEIIKDTCDTIWLILQPTYMKPPTLQDWRKIQRRFNHIWQFPNCIGSLDGKHVSIRAPPKSSTLFRWFKFTLKPPYSIAHDNLRLAIWDTSFWTFWLKFGHKGPWDIS